jgi:hypothetical protein
MISLKRAILAPALVVTALFAVGTPQAVADDSPAIIGGTPATATYGFSGSLQLNDHDDPNWHTCGVTLIDINWAETNAHCVTNPDSLSIKTDKFFDTWRAQNVNPMVDRSDPSIYHIRFGSNDRLNGGVVRHVKKIVAYSGWDWGNTNAAGEMGDIALLQLDAPVTTIKPAVIRAADRSKVGREIGWGYTSDPAGWTGAPPQNLSQVDEPVVDNANCSDEGIAVGELCVGGAGGGTCNGDSGSPVLQLQGTTWSVAIGSTSRTASDDCGDVGEHDIYTDLSHFAGWMTGVMYGGPTGAAASRG